MVIRMLKGVDNSVGKAFDKGIDDANIYDHRRMMSQKRTGKGRSCHTAICEFLFCSALQKNQSPHLGKGSIFVVIEGSVHSRNDDDLVLFS